MSHENPQGSHVIKGKSGGSGLKWLAGAAVAAVLVGGGYFALKNFGPAGTPPAETAYNDTSSTAPIQAGPVQEQTTTEETTTEQTAPSTGSTQTRTQTTTSRRRQVAAAEYVPEQVIGVEPASPTYNDESAIVVQGQRRPVWTRTPSAQRLSVVYPERALERGREGEASVHCTVQQNGSLACVQFSEAPLHAGFGNAALRVARLFRHAPERADGSSAVGSPVNLRVVFRMADNERRG